MKKLEKIIAHIEEYNEDCICVWCKNQKYDSYVGGLAEALEIIKQNK